MSLSRPARTAIVDKGGIKCKECNIRNIIDENHETCQLCYEIFKPNLSGNKVIDDIIRNTRFNFVKGKIRRILEFVPYDQFKNIEFIAEGGFSKIYKAIWVDGPINEYYSRTSNTTVRNNNYTVVLKNLNNSKNITSKELNELKISWRTKMERLHFISFGLLKIHSAKIIHRDLHSGNIFFDELG
ncbi:unnamed protein product [Rhizophagus irregularis]|nr:unnamed protein product [Rhizophagus irregularis]